MEKHKSYKKRGTPDCRISLSHYHAGIKMAPHPHWHPEIEILFAKTGQLTYLVDEHPISLATGDILILAPGQAHQLLTASPDVDVRYLIFSLDAVSLPQPHVFEQEFVQPLQSGLLQLPQVLRSDHPAHDQIHSLLSQLHTHPIYTANYKIIFYTYTVVLCSALLPWCKKADGFLPSDSTTSGAVHTATLYINNHYFQPITLSSVANRVHLNPNYLSTILKQQTGKSFLQYLTHVRVNAAVFLLRRDDLSMSQVAEAAGFGSEAMFYRRFKAIMGMTPRAYQKQQQFL